MVKKRIHTQDMSAKDNYRSSSESAWNTKLKLVRVDSATWRLIRKGTKMATITINGNRITVAGNATNISVKNGEVRVGGTVIKDGLVGEVNIKWEGPLAELEADGNVTCGDVSGNVTAGGNITCRQVGESLSAGGSVRCDKVGGSINAGGSVRVS